MAGDFSSWDERYQKDGFYYGTEPNDFLKAQAASLKPHGRVLCLAEGEGRNAVYLASLGFQVTAVDGSRVGLEKLARLADERGVRVETVCTDLADFDLGVGAWDAIVSIWCHLPPELRGSLYRKAVGALAPGGRFLLEAYTPKQLEYKTGGPPNPALMPTLAALLEELKGLKPLWAQELERVVQEGKGHSGRSAVVQFLAEKS